MSIASWTESLPPVSTVGLYAAANWQALIARFCPFGLTAHQGYNDLQGGSTHRNPHRHTNVLKVILFSLEFPILDDK
jgi:hypothetical protein